MYHVLTAPAPTPLAQHRAPLHDSVASSMVSRRLDPQVELSHGRPDETTSPFCLTTTTSEQNYLAFFLTDESRAGRVSCLYCESLFYRLSVITGGGKTQFPFPVRDYFSGRANIVLEISPGLNRFSSTGCKRVSFFLQFRVVLCDGTRVGRLVSPGRSAT